VNVAPTPPTDLAGWVTSEIDPNAVHRGGPAGPRRALGGRHRGERLRDLAEPARPGELLMITTGRDRRRRRAAPRVAIATLATAPRGAGGARRRSPGRLARTGDGGGRQAARARFGTALTRNSSLELAPAARGAAGRAGGPEGGAGARRPGEPAPAGGRRLPGGAAGASTRCAATSCWAPSTGCPRRPARSSRCGRGSPPSRARSSPTRSRFGGTPCSSDIRLPPRRD
jgi:hypothetical protein